MCVRACLRTCVRARACVCVCVWKSVYHFAVASCTVVQGLDFGSELSGSLMDVCVCVCVCVCGNLCTILLLPLAR